LTEVLNSAIKPDIQLYLKRGACYAHLGTAEAAQRDFDQYITEAIAKIGSTTDPNLADFYDNRGVMYENLKQYNRALQDYEQALRLNQHSSYQYKHLAWLLATCPDATIRDGKRALAYAAMLCEQSHYSDGDELDTLAAAHASIGNFAEAVNYEHKAIAHAYDDGRILAFTQRLQRYLSNIPYIQEE
jgi:tetratricopeptide (TPR) repeat protein